MADLRSLWSSILQRSKETLPIIRKADSKKALALLEKDYGITLSSIDPAELDAQGFQPLPGDAFAHISGMLQQVPGLIYGKSMQGAYQQTYANAYRVLIPERCRNLSFMKNSKLTEEFDGTVKDLTLVDSANKTRGKAGIQEITPPDVQAQQIAYAAFSVASIATNQYFLYRIDKKLENIQKTTESILEFLELDKRSKLQARCRGLERTRNDLGALLDPDHQRDRDMELLNLKRVREEAQADVSFYQAQAVKEAKAISEKGMKKEDLQQHLSAVISNLSSYWTSLYCYELSVLLQLILQEDKGHEKLETERQELIVECNAYSACCQQCGEAIKKSSISMNWLATAGVSVLFGVFIGAAAGAVMAGMSESKVKKNVAQSMGGKTLEEVIQGWSPEPLVSAADSITLLDQVANSPIELAVSDERAYIRLPEKSEVKQELNQS